MNALDPNISEVQRAYSVRSDAASHLHAEATKAGSSEEIERPVPEIKRAIGMVDVDDVDVDNISVQINVSEEGRMHFRRDLYVSIQDQDQDVEFLGRIVEGPFHESRKDSGYGDASYGVRGVVELLGELANGTRLVPTSVRPRPNSSVAAFPADRLRKLLGIGGDLYLGRLIGGEGVRVHMKSGDKNFLPRNVGVFGTVGSGKSNTVQVLMEEAVRAGWAVVTIDVEGEYVGMDAPTSDPPMIEILRNTHGLEPGGIEDFRVYVPASGQTQAASPIRFKVPISAMETEVVSDILEFSEGDIRMFGAATKQAASRNEYLARQQAGPVGRAGGGGPQRLYSLQDLIDGLQESNQSVPLIPRIRPEDLPTAAALRAKLVHLGRSDVLDWNATATVAELPVDDLLEGGRLSVIDVSDADDRSRNVAIAYTLQALFDRVVQTPIGKPMPNGRVRPPLMVVVEEVHTFVSRATAHRMRAVLDNLQVISRRGRKRWMALALVSQQPNHVPNELFELANTRFMHQLKSEANVDAVKNTTGGVHAALWSTISSLGPGQCLLSSSAMKNAMLLAMRPASSRRTFSE